MKSVQTALTVAVGAALVSLSAHAQATQGNSTTQSGTTGMNPSSTATQGASTGQDRMDREATNRASGATNARDAQPSTGQDRTNKGASTGQDAMDRDPANQGASGTRSFREAQSTMDRGTTNQGATSQGASTGQDAMDRDPANQGASGTMNDREAQSTMDRGTTNQGTTNQGNSDQGASTGQDAMDRDPAKQGASGTTSSRDIQLSMASGTTSQGASTGQDAMDRDPANQGASATTNERDNQSGLADNDRQFLEDAIQGSYAEIEGSQLALEKSENAEVRKFAEHMIADHSKMAKEGAALATKKGLTPPDGPSAMQTTEITALKALTGGAFDAMYVNRIGVASHEATVEMFEEASQNAQDPEIKAMATKTLPKLREHLEMARTLNEKQEKQ